MTFGALLVFIPAKENVIQGDHDRYQGHYSGLLQQGRKIFLNSEYNKKK